MSEFVYAPGCPSLDHVRIDTLMKMREDGMTNDEIAKKFNVSSSTIGEILPKKYRRTTREDRDGIVRAWHQGKNKTEIATMFGFSESTVVDILRANGVAVPMTKKGWTTKEIRNLERYMDKGMSPREIASNLGRTEGSVSGFISGHYKNRKKKNETKLRLDGTPEPEKKEEPKKEYDMVIDFKLPENAIVVDKPSSISVEEYHRKEITGKFGTYLYDMDKDFLVFETQMRGANTRAELGLLVEELQAVFNAIS